MSEFLIFEQANVTGRYIGIRRESIVSFYPSSVPGVLNVRTINNDTHAVKLSFEKMREQFSFVELKNDQS